jgi:hypothetical protein
MRLVACFSVCLSLAIMTLSAKDAEFSHHRDLPPLKLASTDLDTILLKTHSLIAAANGPSAEQDSGRQSVKLHVRGHEIEIPHFSLASNLAFPKEIFRFCYTYHQSDKPVSSVSIDLGDSSRRISVSGQSADNVGTMASLLENDFRHYSTAFGGAKFRRVVGVCLLMVFLTSLMVGSVYWWKTRNYSALGMPICSALGLLLVLLLPWNRLLPGFVLYQRYSPFFLIRFAPQISVLALVATLAGIALSYFLSRKER